MAKARKSAGRTGIGPTSFEVRRRPRVALLCSTALQAVTVLILANPARAQIAPTTRPQGGQVVAGTASIGQTTTNTTIQQTTQRAAIDWRSYSVGADHTVTYNQPNSTASTLNRVTGGDPSVIAGRIVANGTVVLVNQSGVVFSRGAQVDVNGLVVSSANIRNQDFMAGKLNFSEPGRPDATIVNQGTISIKDSGLAALVAPGVANQGVIVAKMGKVILGGAAASTVDLYGDGLLSIDVTGQVKQVPVGPDGKQVTALVTNSGTILADGGTVLLTARAVDGIVTNLVSTSGRIQANTAGGQTGRVTLQGIGGGIVVDGDVVARGTMAETRGGSVQALTTGTVAVPGTARISVSGRAGGGTVALGTTLARAAGPQVTGQPMAKAVTVAKGATIKANATDAGKGGSVVVLSSDTTTMNGTLSAKGGPKGGDGGFVEVSGDHLSINSGKIDVTAPLGQSGTILFDPDNLTIVASGGNIDGTFGGTLLTADDAGSTDTLSSSILNGMSGNVTLQALHTIDVESSFSISAGGLTMQAGDQVKIGLGFSVGARDDIVVAINGAVAGTPATSISTPNIAVAGTLASSSGSVFLLSGLGGIISVANQGVVSVPTAGKSVVIQGDNVGLFGSINAAFGTVAIAPATAGHQISMGGSSSAGTLGLFNLFGGINASVLEIGRVTIGGTPTVTAGGITFDKSVDLTGRASTLDLHATGAVARTGTNILTVGTLTGASGSFDLSSGSTSENAIGTVGSYDGGTGFFLRNAGGTFAGTLKADAIFVESDLTGTMSLNGTVTAKNSLLFEAGGSIIVGTAGKLDSPSVTLYGVNSNITLNGSALIGQAAGTVDLSASTGITQASTGTILAGTLTSSFGLGGTISLLGTANAIDTIAIGTTIGGSFQLADTSALSIGTSTLAATGNIYLQDSNAGGITIGAGGVINAGTAGIASLLTDKLVNGGTISAGTIELAPNTSGSTISLGSGYLPSLTGLNAGLVRVGAVTLGGTIQTPTAGSINVGADFGAGTVALDLRATGAVSETAGKVVTASVLTGSAGTIALGNTVNVIGTLGDIAASAGALSLGNTGSLLVSGTVSANNLTLAAGTLGLTGSLNVGTVLALGATAGGVSQAATAAINVATLISSGSITGGVTLAGTANTIGTLGAITTGGTLTVVNNQSLSLAGAINVGAAGTLDITTLGTASHLTQPSGNIVAGVLTSSGKIGGGVTLTVGGNQIGTLANFASGGTLTLFNNALLNTAGTVTAPTMSFIATSMAIGGTLHASNKLTIRADGGLTQAASSVINVGTFANSGTMNGVNLAGTANTIGTIANFSYKNGFTLVDTSALTLIGSLGGTGATSATITAPSISIPSGGVLNGGTVTLTTTSSGVTQTGTGQIIASSLSIATTGTGSADVSLINPNNQIAASTGIQVANGNLTFIDDPTLTLTGTFSANNLYFAVTQAGDTIALGSGGTPAVLTSTLGTGGRISLVADKLTNDPASTITATTGTVEIAPFSTTVAMHVAGVSGLVVDANLQAGINTGSGGRLVLGSYTSGGQTITASGIAFDGNATLTGKADTLVLNTLGGISQTAGTLAVDTLTGTAATGFALGQSGNAVGTLASFAVSSGDFSLTNNGNTSTTTVSGPVTAKNVSIASNSGSVVVTGSIGAGTLIALSAGNGGLTLGGTAVVNATSGGTVDLSATGGGVTQSGNTGTIIAGTLTSSGTAVGGASLFSSTNTIGTLGDFAFSGGALSLRTTGTLTTAGTIGTGDVTLRAGAVKAVSGNVFSTGASGTLDVTTSSGDFSQVAGGIINAGTLLSSGGIAGSVILQGTSNAISTISALSPASGTLTIVNRAALALAGAINLGSGTLDVTTLGSGADVTQAAGGTITAGTLTSTGGIAGSANLAGTANAIATITAIAATGSLLVQDGSAVTLGSGTVSAGTTLAVNAPTITASGSLIAPTVSLTATTGSIDLTGTINASTAAVLSGKAGIAGASGAVIGNGSLSAISASGAVDLSNGAANVIASASGSAASDWTLADSVALNLGNVTAGTLAVGTAPTLTVSGSVQAPTVTLTASTGTLTLTGTVNASTAAVLSGAAAITGSSGVVNTASLSAISSGGSVDLSNGAGNIVVAASGSAATGWTLNDSVALNLGDVSAGSASASAPTLTASGIVTAPTVSLTASNGTLTLSGTVDASTSASLSGQAGVAGASGVILGDGSVSAISALGDVILTNVSNAIGTLGGSAAGTFWAVDASGLTLANITAPTIYLQDINANGITFAAGATLLSTTLVSLRTDKLVNLGGIGDTGAIDPPVFELAPNTDGNLLTLGTTSSGLYLAGVNGITASRIRLGAVTQPGSSSPTILAGSIAVAGPFNAQSNLIELDAHVAGSGNGDVGQTAPLLNVGTLVGQAQSFTLTNTLNSIATLGIATVGTLGSLFAVNGATVVSGVDMTVAGDVVGSSVLLDAQTKALTVTGEAAANGATGSVTLKGGTITLDTAGGGVLPVVAATDGGSVSIISTGALTQNAGIINAGEVDLSGTLVTLSNGLVVATAGTIGVAGGFVITGSETIATVNGTATAGTDISFSGSGTVAGSALVSALGSLTVQGILAQSGGQVSASNVALGGLDMTGGLIAADTSNGGFVGSSSGTIVAGDPGSTATTGSFSQSGGTILLGSPTDIFTTGTFSQTGGTLVSKGRLGVTASSGILVEGVLSAGTLTRSGTTNQGFMLLANAGNAVLDGGARIGGPTLAISSGTLFAGNAIAAPAGTVLVMNTLLNQPFGPSFNFTAGTADTTPYTLVAPAVTVPLGTATTLPSVPTISAASIAPTVPTGAIPMVLAGATIDIRHAISASVLGLYAKNAITQAATAGITATTLTGAAGVLSDGALVVGLTTLGWANGPGIGWQSGVSETLGTVALGSTLNSVGTLSDFRVTRDFAFVDSSNLATVGTVQAGMATTAGSANSLSVQVIGGNTLSVGGVIVAGADDSVTRPGGNTTLTAGAVNVNTGAVIAAVKSSGQGGAVGITGTSGAVTQSAGLINGGTVDLNGTGVAVSAGTIVATEGTLGITGDATLTGGTIAAVNNATEVKFTGNVTQTAGYVGSNGTINVTGVMNENGGTMLAVGNINLAALSETSGTIGAGSALFIGGYLPAGGNVAGIPGSSATSGSFFQSGGTAMSNSGINIFVTQAAANAPAFNQTGGTLVTSGTLGVTANSSFGASAGTVIAVDGTIAAAGTSSGFRLLANQGNIMLGTNGIIGGPALTVTPNPVVSGSATIAVPGSVIPGNALQAPNGTVTVAGSSGTVGFRNEASAATGTISSTGYTIHPTGSGAPTLLTGPSISFTPTLLPRPVVLLGQVVDIQRPITASTLGLYGLSAVRESGSGAITADVLTGSVGERINGTLEAGLSGLGWSNTGSTSLGWISGTTDILGSATLNAAANAINKLSDFRVTSDFALVDSVSLIQSGTVQAGSALTSSYGTTAAVNNLAITVNSGSLAVNGVIASGIYIVGSTFPGGNVTLTAPSISIAKPTVTSGSGPILPVIAAVNGSKGGGTLAMNATAGGITQSAGVINGALVTLQSTGGITLGGGYVVATEGTIGFTAPLVSILANESIVTVNNATDIVFSNDVTQAAGSAVRANRDVTVGGALTEAGGAFLAVRDITVGSAIAESSGVIGAGRNLTLGTGTGTAGRAGSSASGATGTFSQSGGTVVANGNINMFVTQTTSGVAAFNQTGGIVVSNGTLGVTADSAITNPADLIFIGGSIAAAGSATGFSLLANAGNVTVAGTGQLSGPTLTATGNSVPGNVIQAPSGTVLFAAGATMPLSLAGSVSVGTNALSLYDLVCPDCTGLLVGSSSQPSGGLNTLPLWLNPDPQAVAGTTSVASIAGSGTLSAPGSVINAAIIADTIDIERTIAAAVLGLYAKTLITEGGTGVMINAGTITGSVGALRNGAISSGLTALGWTTTGSGSTGLNWRTGSVDTIGTVALGGTNEVLTLSDFSSTGNFSFADIPFGAARTLFQIRTLQAGSGLSDSSVLTATTLSVTTQGTLSVAGTIADGIADNATRPAANVVLNAGSFVAAGPVTTAGSIDIAGTVSANGTTATNAPTGNVTLTSTGRITEGGGANVGAGTGAVIAGRLTGSSGDSTTLDHITNHVGSIGPFSAGGSGLTLRNDVTELTALGLITGANVLLQNGVTGGGNSLTLANGATIGAAGSNVTLLAPGTISVATPYASNAGTIHAATLTLPNAATANVGTGTVSATGVSQAARIVLGDATAANPAAINQIGTLSAVNVSGTLMIADAEALTLSGDISAPAIRIGDSTGITFVGDRTVTTGGSVLTRPGQSSAPPDTNASSGLNLAILGGGNGIINLGTNLTVVAMGTEANMRIALTGGGQVQFGTLSAPATDLLLHVGTGKATQSTGNIDVKNLFAFYRTGSSISLSGKVDGKNAAAAATASRIGIETSTPAFAASSSHFQASQVHQINVCPIASVNCVLTSNLNVPPQLPIFPVPYSLPDNILDNPDQLLPFISDQAE